MDGAIDVDNMQGEASLADSVSAAGAERLRFLQSYEHPITCETVTFSAEPVPVFFLDPIDTIK